MKIYFSAAIYYKKELGEYYDRILKSLDKAGHHVFSYGVNTSEIDDILNSPKESQSAHYKKVVNWIAESDVVVVEASFPSTLHIGHEIALAAEKGKPVVVLYEEKRKPFFLMGNQSEKILLTPYNNKNLEQVVIDTIEYASEQVDTRFNFFISPAIGSYLDWISKNKRVPRAVYLRRLIENDMRENKEYIEVE